MVDRYFRVKVGISTSVASRWRPWAPKPEAEPRIFSRRVARRGGWRRRCCSRRRTRASDVYSFAVVLWELRSLQVPWAQVGQWRVMHAVVEEGQRPDLDEVPTPTFSSLSQYDALIGTAGRRNRANAPRSRRSSPGCRASSTRTRRRPRRRRGEGPKRVEPRGFAAGAARRPAKVTAEVAETPFASRISVKTHSPRNSARNERRRRMAR